MRSYCAAQEILLNDLCWPKREGNPKKRRHTCNWFPLQYSRNQHNIAKQPYFNTVFFFLKKGLKQSGPCCVLHLVSLYRPPCPLHFSHRNPAAPHMSLLSAKLLTRTCLLHLPLYLRTSHLLSKGFPDDHHLKLDMHTCVHINCISQESRKILSCLGTV